MTEPSRSEDALEMRSLSSWRKPTVSAIWLASWLALAGHLVVLVAAVTESVPSSTAIAAGGACSILVMAALTTLEPRDVRVRRAVTALTGGHGVAAAILALGLVPAAPRAAPLVGLGAAVAVALGLACLVVVRRTSTDRGLPLTMAPRLAAIILVVQAVAQRWVAPVPGVSMPLRVAISLAVAALGIALLASLSVICLRVRSRWAIAGLLAWTVGWVANTAELLSLVLVSLGRPLPTGLLPALPAELVQIVAKAGGAAIGAVLVTSIRDVRARHSALMLLAGCVIFGVVAAVAAHRIALATDFPRITALRSDLDRADAITAVALAGLLWLYWRRVALSARGAACSRPASPAGRP